MIFGYCSVSLSVLLSRFRPRDIPRLYTLSLFISPESYSGILYIGHFYKLIYNDFGIFIEQIARGRREHSELCDRLTMSKNQ